MPGPERVVIITGASRGIGLAAARWLAGSQASVVLVSRSAEGLRRATGEVEAGGGRALAVAEDLADPAAARRIVEAALDRFGAVHAVVNNAATIEPVSTVAEVDLGAWLDLVRLNLLGPLAMCQAALPSLRASAGRIVNVVTIVATMPVPALSGYASSKAALVQMTRVLALEEPSVTALALDPGPTDSDMMVTLRQGAQAAMPQQWAERYEGMQRDSLLNPPELPARSIAWLALHAPPTMSGELVTFDRPDVAGPALESFGSFGGEPLRVATPPPPPT